MEFPPQFYTGIIGSIVFLLIGIVGLIGGFKLFDWLLPKVDFQEKMQENAIACAIVVAAFLLALSHVVANVVK